MCEIFSTIGAMLLASAGVSASAATTATVGAVAAASTVAGLTSTGLGIASSIRSAHEGTSRMSAAQDALLKQNGSRLTPERTASQLKDNVTTKRTITSLRIPLDKTANTGLNTQSGQTVSGTGLNIPT